MRTSRNELSRGVALIMVLLVLSALAMIGAPFVISMAHQDRASLNFAGTVAAREAAEAVRNHAIAHLERTAYGYEYEEEEEALDAERPKTSVKTASKGSRSSAFRPRHRSQPKKRGMITRRDMGEKPLSREEKERLQNRGRDRLRNVTDPRDRDSKKGADLPESLKVSKKGPSAREYDLLEEWAPRPLDRVKIPGASSTLVSQDPGAEQIRFMDPTGVTGSAAVWDEQGKININTAPPNLIANLFGVSQLASLLSPRDTKLILDDASMFPGDLDDASIDGAVIVQDPDAGAMEAVTYRKKDGDALDDCFRGAFLSLILNHVYPAGSFVYDLRGWKAGYHRLWAEREGGFHPRELTKFSCVEAIREIAGWQVASLFVTRFRGEGLTADFLREAGVNLRKVSELGLDPYIFAGGDAGEDPGLKKRYEDAKKQLRKLGLKSEVVQKLQAARGSRVVIDLAARLDGADKERIKKVETDLEKSLSSDRRRAPSIPVKYLQEALKHLAEVYRTPGIETIDPEDLEWLRDCVTASSSLPVEWSEAQAVLDDVSLTGPDYVARVPRASGCNPGTILRIRSHADPSALEFNEAATTGKNIPHGGIRFAYPLQSSLRGYDGTVQGLQRHPVNANTASRRVLRAIFTGVRGYAEKQVVTPYEADQLAVRVEGARPLKGHEDFHELLKRAVDSTVIDPEDLQPLLTNAIQPTHALLRVSTTGFAYSTGDVYTIESRGILRSPAGTEIASSRFREIVEISAPRRLSTGLMTQGDLADGVFLLDPTLARGFPENRHQYLLEFPGTRSHLVLSRPLLLHRAPLSFPGGDLGNLRLFPAETPETMPRFTLGPIDHFRETYEGLELAQGESYPVSLSLSQGGAGAGPQIVPASPGAPGAAGAQSSLNMVPGGIEFWCRMRTYPDARNEDGYLILFDAGTELDRNRITLLYEDRSGRVRLRIADASIQDPSVRRTKENGQYLEITANRPLELETWYHFRIVWDGVFGGGAQLFIDGIPQGTDNLSSELVSAIPEAGNVGSIAVKDASKFPDEGVVRIDQELFEYRKSGNSLQVRREQPTMWQPITRSKATSGRRGIQPPEPPPPEGPGGPGRNLAPMEERAEEPLEQAAPGPGGAGAPQGPAVDMTIKRAPGNRRGSVNAAHSPGARVAVHGYSLEMRRKIRDPRTGDEFQISDGDGNRLVWGPGGLRSLEPLQAFNFPPDVSEIIHLDINPGEVGSQGEFIVPLFHLDSGGAVQGGLFVDRLTAVSPAAPRNAVDYFQSKGVLTLDGQPFYYKQEDLPQPYIPAQARYPNILEPQTKGLRILSDYTRGGDSLQNWQRIRKNYERDRWMPSVALVDGPVTHRSLLADGVIKGRYPETGVLELRGSPTPWEPYRQSFYGQAAFAAGRNGTNPDDLVEWIRYVDIVDEGHGGEMFHMFVGRAGGNFNFRGYPERDDPAGAVDLRKQLDHPIREPLRLVMELSEGGAGYGDYVTIATKDPNIYEPVVRRVYKVLEHEDGRFFVSLMDVGQNGMDLPNAPPIPFRNSYTMDMNPRLVKFPTWGLPEIPAPTGLIFGDVVQGSGSGGAGRSNLAGVRNDEDEDPTGITLDEVRKLQNRTIQRDPRYTVRHVVVPLDGGSVRFRGGGQGGASISGTIPGDRTISRSSPMEVYIVTLSRERGFPSLFAQGEDEGIIRIGDELFYFEDPLAAGKGASGKGLQAGMARLGKTQQDPNQPNPQNPQQPVDPNAITYDTTRERGPLARTSVWDRINVDSTSGHFEREGFARLEDRDRERMFFHEVFYYKQFSGGFSQCLRGQFGTPIAQKTSAAFIHNVTRRLRLVGRSLLGTEREPHGLGDAVSLVPYMNIQPVTGPVTSTGLPVKKTDQFGRSGYLLMDSGEPSMPWEIIAHLGPQGEALLARPRDERGRGILRACFGTKERPISQQMFAYDMPYRYPDRYELEADSESLAYLQKSFRIPGAYWRSIEWTERPSRTLRDRRADVVILARFDGGPEWDEKATNAEGGLYFLEDTDRRENAPARAELDRVADQLEIRICFRYPSGAFSRLPGNKFTDDWKETPVLESLTIEYEKAGAIVRHEELPF